LPQWSHFGHPRGWLRAGNYPGLDDWGQAFMRLRRGLNMLLIKSIGAFHTAAEVFGLRVLALCQ